MSNNEITYFEKLKVRANQLKTETAALYLAYKRPEVPWYAKFFAIIVVGYALSPIDLIPDFIPILGYLDDLILIPIGISVAIKLIPEEIMNECRSQATELFKDKRPKSYLAVAIIILIWILIISVVIYKIIL